jgi:hypothetical protein
VVFGGLMTPHNYEIVDCGAFCEVIFFASHPRICLGTFSTVSPEVNNTPSSLPMQISTRYLQFGQSAGARYLQFRVGAKALPAMVSTSPVKASCLLGARTDEEDSPISYGRFFLTYYFPFRIFNPSRSKHVLITSLYSLS